VLYVRALRWSVLHRMSILGFSFAVLLSIFLIISIFNPGVEFIPENIPPSRTYLQVETPVGTNVDFTKSVIDKLQHKIPNIPNNDDIKTVLSTAGSAISAAPWENMGNSSHLGTIVLNFKDFEK